MKKFPQAFNALAKLNQFIITKDKIPVNPETGKKIDPYNSYNWMTCHDSIRYFTALGDSFRLGFILTADDPFFFIDIDHCLNDDNETWSDLSKTITAMFNGAAVEISQSGEGLHIIGTSQHIEHKCKNTDLDIEFYTEKRIISLTGTHACGDSGKNFDVSDFVHRYFKYTSKEDFQWSDQPVEEWTGYKDDDELINHALKSKGFQGKCSFKDLWLRDEDALAEAYPDHHGNRSYDESSADAALISHLSFWTGKNCQRIYDLLWESKLVRDKWDVPGYLKRSILNGVSLGGGVYTHGKKNTGFQGSLPDCVQVRQGDMRLSVQQQVEFFAGCVYVKRFNRVLTPTGELLCQDAFNWEYGGHIFELHHEDMTRTTTKAWDALRNSFTLSWPKVTSTCFKTDMAIGEITEMEGQKLVNMYVDVKTERKQGDISPFMDLLKKLLPSDLDQQILLCYMAACLQYKGQKFRYAPVLQGVEGNGKTFMSQCLKHAIGRRYTHFPVTNDLKSTFNVWICNHLLICIEEFNAPGNRNEVIENLKVLISNEEVGVQPKGVDQYTADNCANFMFTTQYKDAIKKTNDNRRFAIFYTAQQTKKDLMRDGMDDAYFNSLINWAKGGGYACINEFLSTYEILDKYNPTLLARAPDTSMISEVIHDSMSTVEKLVLETIGEGRLGFNGGWVSSMALERLLKEKGLTKFMNINKRKEMLMSLGYNYHPNLKEGRATRGLNVDGGKPRLFIKYDSLCINLVNPSHICDAYEKAQGDLINDSLQRFN